MKLWKAAFMAVVRRSPSCLDSTGESGTAAPPQLWHGTCGYANGIPGGIDKEGRKKTSDKADLEGGVALHEAVEGGVHSCGQGVQHVLAMQGSQVQQHLHSCGMKHAAQPTHASWHQSL